MRRAGGLKQGKGHSMETGEERSNTGPLVGIRVVDFGTFVAGTYNAVLLGEMGAEVIKVESLEGDAARQLGPFMGGESRAFVGWNRNKRGLAIDLQSAPGVEVVHKLVARADVVTMNFRPGVTETLKLEYETLRAINPALIYCASTGFGHGGPWRDRPSFDAVLQTMGGIAMSNAVPAGKVSLSAPVLIDMHTAMIGLAGILAALYHREKTGQGQKVETTLVQGVMSLEAARFCRPLERELEGTPGGAPYALYATKDSYLFVGALINRHFRAFCDVLGLPELAKDPRYKTMATRVDNHPELREQIEAVTKRRTSAEWEVLLSDKNVPAAVPMTHDEFFDSEQVGTMGMRPVIDHTAAGPVQVYGTPFTFEKTPSGIQRSAPCLGEHNAEILAELGYGEAEIESMREAGIIRA